MGRQIPLLLSLIMIAMHQTEAQSSTATTTVTPNPVNLGEDFTVACQSSGIGSNVIASVVLLIPGAATGTYGSCVNGDAGPVMSGEFTDADCADFFANLGPGDKTVSFAITSTGAMHEQLVTCQFVYGGGLVAAGSADSPLFVSLPPTDNTVAFPNDASVGTNYYLGETRLATCSTRGVRPTPDLAWFVNDVEVAANTSEVMEQGGTFDATVTLYVVGSSLQMQTPRKIDCRSKAFGMTFQTAQYYMFRSPELTLDPTAGIHYIEAGQSQTFRCAANNANPGVDLTWIFANGSALSPPSGQATKELNTEGSTNSFLDYQIVASQQLSPQNPSLRMRCFTSPSVANSGFISLTLMYLTDPEDAKIQINEDGRLECPFEGMPSVTYEWYNVGATVDDLTLIPEAGTGKIYSANPPEDYYIGCKATNTRLNAVTKVATINSAATDNKNSGSGPDGLTIGLAVAFSVVGLVIITVVVVVLLRKRNTTGKPSTAGGPSGSESRSVVYTQGQQRDNARSPSGEQGQAEKKEKGGTMIYANLDLSKQAAGLVPGKRTALSVGETMYAEIDLLRTHGQQPQDQPGQGQGYTQGPEMTGQGYTQGPEMGGQGQSYQGTMEYNPHAHGRPGDHPEFDDGLPYNR